MSDFKVFTGLLKAQELDGRKVINTTASSSSVDRHGDQITPEAIRSMATQAATSRMTIFLNHEYRVPEDVFGSVIAANATAKQNGVWELQLGIEVDETNPRALATYKMLRGKNDDGKGAKLGVSIGALIKDYELMDTKDIFSAMQIKDVELLEASIVGIPANPDSWVKQASKSLRKQLREQQAPDEADGPDVLDMLDKAVAIAKSDEPEPAEETDSDEEEETSEPTPDADPLTSDESDAHDELDEVTKSIDDEQPTVDVELTVEEQPVAPEQVADGPDAEELAVLAMTDKVIAMSAKLSDRDRQITELTKQRDDAVASLRLAMKFVERLARTPLGRKTSFSAPISDFRTRFGQIYDEDFLAFLENKNES